jgi:cytochrome c-type biogenesis protein
MNESQGLSFFIAYAAGVLSFLSPCVLPLVPSYVAFITGLSFDELTQDRPNSRLRWVVISHSLLFILGFSVLFTALGASASLIGQFLTAYRDIIRIVGGILIIVFGLLISGIFSLGFLQREKKFHLHSKPLGYLGSFLVGVTFAAGWTPCVGPILSSILLVASTADDLRTGMLLLFTYSLGLGLPFFICALAFNTFLSFFKRANKFLGILCKVGGLLLILVGILLLTDSFSLLVEGLMRWFPIPSLG